MWDEGGEHLNSNLVNVLLSLLKSDVELLLQPIIFTRQPSSHAAPQVYFMTLVKISSFIRKKLTASSNQSIKNRLIKVFAQVLLNLCCQRSEFKSLKKNHYCFLKLFNLKQPENYDLVNR